MKKNVLEMVFFVSNLFKWKTHLTIMNPTQIDSDKMIDRESFLSRVLETGGKVLDNELPAFQKKFQAFE